MAEKDYIEREAFLEQKREQYCKDCARRKGMRNGKYKTLYEIGEAPCRACEIDDVLNDVEDFPAADVRENTRGKCTDEARYFFCSECGYGVQDVFEGNYSDKNEVLLFERGKGWNFCPNCGAMMEES